MSGRHLLVKICGLSGPGDLEAAEGADMVGVVINVPHSPRNRSWVEAKEIFRAASGRFVPVAVLVDPSVDSVERALKETGAEFVQVHGKLPDGLAQKHLTRVIPSLGLPRERTDGRPAAPPETAGLEDFPFVHLDSASDGAMGGTGQAPDRRLVRLLVENHPEIKFLLGGGLTPLNVVSALRDVCPAGVDVSSGVESSPGVKSPKKMSLFIQAVRKWEARHA
jgi:phosphoribosylanthranilate isomerase